MFPTLDVSLLDTLKNLVLAAVMSAALGQIYIRCGSSFSNRRALARSFYLLSMTIALIITIVKSSLALSLGLVGALSIVRYRAAIKEPEELAYLFVAIAIGLGLGAEQELLTVGAFLVIVAVILVHDYYRRWSTTDNGMNYNLSVVLPKAEEGNFSLETIVELLNSHCKRVQLKRFEETNESLDMAFLIEYENLAALNNVTAELQRFNGSARVLFLDHPYE